MNQPMFSYLTHVANAQFAFESAAEYMVDDNERESVEFGRRLSEDSDATQLALIEFVLAHGEELKEAFR
jgi:hypothetical protein